MRRVSFVVCCLALWTGALSAAELPQWLIGEWTRPSRHGETRERWRAVSDRTLEGEAWRVTPDGKRVPTESLLLVAMGDGTFYIPRPAENPLPVAFRLIESGDRRLLFENRDHDFPQRICYELGEGGALEVWIAGPGDDGRERRISFPFTRVEKP